MSMIMHVFLTTKYKIDTVSCVSSELCANEEGNNCFKGNFGNSVVVVERAL